MVSIVLKHSKTDQARNCMKITLGKTGYDLCPVGALLTYLNAKGSHPGPLFQWSCGTPLCKSKFVDEVKLALETAKFPAKQFAGHSFRTRAATIAALAGLPDSAIQTFGRWNSSAFLLYIRTESHKLAKVTHMMS